MVPDIHFLHMVSLLVPALGLLCMWFLYFSHCVCLSLYVSLYMCVSVYEIVMYPHITSHEGQYTFSSYGMPYSTALGVRCRCFLYFSHGVSLSI